MKKTRTSRRVLQKVTFPQGTVLIARLSRLEKEGFSGVMRLPYSIKALLENALRNAIVRKEEKDDDIAWLAGWSAGIHYGREVAFYPSRVILQDFTGVPCVVDLAAMRAAVKRLGGNYRAVDSTVPCDLIVDHSAAVDFYGTKSACKKNLEKEYQRNAERYAFLKWGQKAFRHLRVIPPGIGIIHQINLEYLARGVATKKTHAGMLVYPDSVIGTDSHTPMINALGIVGWGVGGIEAEAVMLGEPLYIPIPRVIGVRVTGALRHGVSAADAVLTITAMLRSKNVVGCFVEFFGDGLKGLSLADRATIANMAPEYGATMGFFPVDDKTLQYYRLTGRSPKTIDLVERYMKEQGMFYTLDAPEPHFSEVVDWDLSAVELCVAGPKRPQDRIALGDVQSQFDITLRMPAVKGGFGVPSEARTTSVSFGAPSGLAVSHGALALASITSCTNTSNPASIIAAALFARNALKRGLTVKKYVKTSFSPGSRVTTEYLLQSGLMASFEKLGFHTVGYGCMTCIGNSGPLSASVSEAVKKGALVLAGVLSGNRNFEGRINPLVKANYLASPLLVVAYALAGTVDSDLTSQPIGVDRSGAPVFLADLMPQGSEVDSILSRVVIPSVFRHAYKDICAGDARWKKIKASTGDVYRWDATSTYIQEPPFFENLAEEPCFPGDIVGVRALLVVGDSVTTDHISPAGAIAADSPAGCYLRGEGVPPGGFNTYGSRRGNDRVMTRGGFANIRLRNLLVPGSEGPVTMHFPSCKEMDVYSAAMQYQREGVALTILAGKEYGTGSSRDWAAKATALLGVRVVLAQSFERIHRSNLIGMGVLPLEYKPGDSALTLGLKGVELFDFRGLHEGLRPHDDVSVVANSPDGTVKVFKVTCRLDTPAEIEYYRNGGILPAVARKYLPTGRRPR